MPLARHGRRSARRVGSIAVLALLTLLGCSSTPTQAPPTDTVTLIQAEQRVAEDQLLDVAVQVFDPGLPEEGQELPPGVFEDVRESEARYMAVQLADTLQGTGHWGAVRVTPSLPVSSDVTVSGAIVLSTGKKLVLQIRAVDATGNVWFDRKYREEANPAAYADGQVGGGDPFRNLYYRVSNDLLLARQQLSSEDVTNIRRVARLGFAAELLPAVYSEYLETDRKGRLEVVRLPAEDDPMMGRVASIQEREAMFVDVLNQHYAYFSGEMKGPYDSWRKYSYDELLAYEAIRRKARTQKILGAIAVLGAVLVSPSNSAQSAIRDIAVLGGMAAIEAGFSTSKQAKIHREALEELAASFDSEVEPMVVQVEGHTVRLTGSIEEQYRAWREILLQIYSTETGFPTDPNSPSGASDVPPPRDR